MKEGDRGVEGRSRSGTFLVRCGQWQPGVPSHAPPSNPRLSKLVQGRISQDLTSSNFHRRVLKNTETQTTRAISGREMLQISRSLVWWQTFEDAAMASFYRDRASGVASEAEAGEGRKVLGQLLGCGFPATGLELHLWIKGTEKQLLSTVHLHRGIKC